MSSAGDRREKRRLLWWCLVGALLIAASPPMSAAQVTTSPADSASRGNTAGLPESGERPPFELPEVVVRGEDLSLVAGGDRLKSVVPELNASPTERPENPPPPGMGQPWRRTRPFSLTPTQPEGRALPTTWWRLGARSEPGLFGHITTGGSTSTPSAWRLMASGEWVEDPVPETSRQFLDVRAQYGSGYWPDAGRWGLNLEGSIRRQDWDLPGLSVEGAQIFSGVRAAITKWWSGSVGEARVEAGQLRPFEGSDEVRWSAVELGWNLGSAGHHPFFWEPGISVRAHGMLGDQRGSSGTQRTWGGIHAGIPVSRDESSLVWLGAQGSWDGDLWLVAPRLLLRWGDPAARVALWARVEMRRAMDPWWNESRERDYTLIDLDRSVTGEAPAVTVGADIERGKWTLRGSFSGRRLRSPRTWREDPTSGLFVPVSASNRWVADAVLRLLSPPMKPVRLEMEAGFFEDGGDDHLAFRPSVWGAGRLWARLDVYSVILELRARGESPVEGSPSLPESFILHAELGRFVGELGRVWVRLNNATDDPAPRWPFVDASRRSVFVGWDFVPRKLRDSF